MPAPTNATPAAKPTTPIAAPRPVTAHLPVARPVAVPFARFMTIGKPPAPVAKGVKLADVPHRPVEHRHRGARERDARDARDEDVDPLDPATRRLAQLAPPPHARVEAVAPAARPAEPAGEVAPRARVSLEELLPQLVRRIAWAGDRRRGSVQLELGAGRHAGTIVTVHADDGRVRVEVQGSDELRARIGERLAGHGLEVESVR